MGFAARQGWVGKEAAERIQVAVGAREQGNWVREKGTNTPDTQPEAEPSKSW